MNLNEILNSIALNLNIRSSDGSSIREDRFTITDLKDQVNRIYREIIAHKMIDRNPDDFTVTATGQTYREIFTVASIDAVNYLINSTTSVFGRADEGSRIQNPVTSEFYEIEQVITSQQIKVKTQPQSSLVGATIYILSPLILLTDIENIKEVLKLQVKYNPNNEYWDNADRDNVINFLQKSDWTVFRNNGFREKVIYTLNTIEVGNEMQRCIQYYPYPDRYDGIFRLVYTKLPVKLVEGTDEPALNAIGISDVIINGVTAWGLKVQKEYEAVSAYLENNPKLGGVVPLGLTSCLDSYMPRRVEPIKFKGFRR